jgi:hypothetical protein
MDINMKLTKILTHLLLLAPAVVLASNADSFNFVTISDIHLDNTQTNTMQINPTGYDQDNDMDKESFINIMNAVSKTISETKSKPEFILYLGDIVGHESFIENFLHRSKFVRSNEEMYFKKILKNNPDTPIINVFGDSDSTESDYGKFEYEKISPYTIAMDSGFKNGFLSTGVKCDKGSKKQVYPCLANENTKYGYFTIHLKKNLVLLGINSVMFSTKSEEDNMGTFREFSFLTNQLNLAEINKDQVIIAMHVPVGNNVQNGYKYWTKYNNEEFLHLLSKHKRIIEMILVGHHMEEFKKLNFNGKKIGEYFTASLSTKYGNSPSFKIFNMDETDGEWSVNNYTTYQTHNINGKPVFNKYYNFVKADCAKTKYKKNINNCLNDILFKDTLPKYTVGNPNNKSFVAKSAKDFTINVDRYDNVIT